MKLLKKLVYILIALKVVSWIVKLSIQLIMDWAVFIGASLVIMWIAFSVAVTTLHGG